MPIPRRNPHDRDILRLAVPALGDLASEPLYLLADTAIVGHLGTTALAGVAVASTLLATGFAFFIVLAYGTTAAVARAVGRGDERAASAHTVAALWLAVGVGAVLAVSGVAFAGPLVRILADDADVAAAGITFLRISALGGPAILVSLVCSGFLRGHQDTRTPFVVTLSANATNLAVEIVLVFVLHLGVAGSALATVLCQYGAAIAFLALVGPRLAGTPKRPTAPAVRSVASTSGALLVRTASLRAALLAATAVAARIGTVELAAYQVGFGVLNLLALLLDAFAIAAQALVGRHLGAGDPEAARAASRRMVQLSMVSGVVLAVVVALARYPLARLFSSDPEVVAATAMSLLAVAAMQPLNAYVFVLDGVLIGAGDHRFLAWAGIVVNVVVFIPAVIAVLPLGAGLAGLWAAIAVLEAGRGVANGLRYHGPRWTTVGAA